MTNYCHNITCLNNGVCRPLLRDFKCECLSNSYSGRHCEIISKKIIVLKTISKSFAYIVVIALACVAIFVIVMDILKYGFGIDPVREERERLRRTKQAERRRQKGPVIQRFVYVNAPKETFIKQNIIVEETA
ncbi:hypothetical protein I4U23_015337 [Adineta vaga]|nr:hypothetical protein I4U23_015337 [Adineta vaga]